MSRKRPNEWIKSEMKERGRCSKLIHTVLVFSFWTIDKKICKVHRIRDTLILYVLSCTFLNQVYRVSDMELVRVLPSTEDEVNVACFHPSVGGGLVYGTKVTNINF